MTVGGQDRPESVFAIGPVGAFLRWESDHWISVSVPTERTLISAAIGGVDALWASDETGSAWHFDGTSWNEARPEQPISRVFVTDQGTVWAQAGAMGEAHGGGSSGGILLRREGNAWVSGPAPFPYCLGGEFLMRENEEIWSTGLVCDAGGGVVGAEVHRYDGSEWQQVGERLTEASWYPRFVVVDGRLRINASLLWEWDGMAWQKLEQPTYPQDLPLDEQAIWDGGAYTVVPSGSDCTSVLRIDASHAWCSGAGQIYFNDGTRWSSTLRDRFDETQPSASWSTLPPALWAGGDTRRAWGFSDSDVFRIRNTAASPLERYDGSAWTTALDYRVNDLDGAAADDVWFATERDPVHFDGEAFTPQPLPSDLSGESLRVQALGQERALLATKTRLFRFDGEWSLLRQAPGTRFMQDFAARGDEIWVVEDIVDRSNDLFLAHFDGTTWSELDASKLVGYAELTLANNEAWAVTDGVINRLGDGAEVAIDRGLTAPWSASLWLGGGAIWLTTPKQALRHALP
jgi:hypothetical protein